MQDALEIDGLTDTFNNWLMGNAAEFIGKQFEVTREEMDEFAYRSHRLAHEATEGGKFQARDCPSHD